VKRKAYFDLLKWKRDPERKPLILKGARQVGKSWLLKKFGEKEYTDYAVFNFDEVEDLKSVFEVNKNPHRIIELLGLLIGRKIVPEKTLIILDEIQECPEALNSLKYFKEQANEYHITAAGSLLGTLLAAPKSFPVGQVNLLTLHPFTFDEFLEAVDEPLFGFFKQVQRNYIIESVFHNKLLEAYNYYLIIGGMPECIASWVHYKDPQRIKQIQSELISIYENDFSKHNSRINSGRTLMVFRSIVSQLSKDNDKFIYGCIKEGARARAFEEAVEWLVSAGMLNRVYNVSKPEYPIKTFSKLNHFKLYLFDTGLLKHMAGIDDATVLLPSDYQFKGALTENYVLQQLQGQFDVDLHYYTINRTEIDFLIQYNTDIIPVEVKGGERKDAPSFKAYIKERTPKTALRYSKRGYAVDGNITNIPLYLACRTKDLI